jgi:hypothetical protein
MGMDQKSAIEYLAVLSDLPLNRTLYKFGRACYRVVAHDDGAVPNLERLPGYERFRRFTPPLPHQIEPRSTRLWALTAAGKNMADPWANSQRLFDL